MSSPVSNPVVQLGVRPPRELVSSTSFLLKRLGWAIKDRASEAYDAVGASPYHYAVLALLDEGACTAQATIADALGYDRSWFVGLLDELEDAGLVERKRDPVDRRRHSVSLKPAGKKRLAQLREISRQVEDDFFAPLDAKEREQLHALLLELAAHHDPRLAQDGY
jgi:MarR family transcriptional regulator, lower aerobic nicotinate degradation pathway regulator